MRCVAQNFDPLELKSYVCPRAGVLQSAIIDGVGWVGEDQSFDLPSFTAASGQAENLIALSVENNWYQFIVNYPVLEGTVLFTWMQGGGYLALFFEDLPETLPS